MRLTGERIFVVSKDSPVVNAYHDLAMAGKGRFLHYIRDKQAFPKARRRLRCSAVFLRDGKCSESHKMPI